MKIVVLLSSYNGEKFIKEQIDSILNQDITKEMELQLLVRDDGSKDGTHEILNEYQEKGMLTWYTGENLRPAKSFWELIFPSLWRSARAVEGFGRAKLLRPAAFAPRRLADARV